MSMAVMRYNFIYKNRQGWGVGVRWDRFGLWAQICCPSAREGFPGGSDSKKNPPVMQETLVRSLAREDLLEKGMTTHFSILAWRIPWTEEPGRLQFMGSQRDGHN